MVQKRVILLIDGQCAMEKENSITSTNTVRKEQNIGTVRRAFGQDSQDLAICFP